MATGLFPPSKSPANIMRSIKRKQAMARGVIGFGFEAGPNIKHRRAIARRIAQKGKKRGPYNVRTPKRDAVAELLAEGMEFDAIAERLEITPKAVRRHFDKIRAGLGPQAV